MLDSIIKSAILHRSLNEKEMLEKGIEFLVFTINFHHKKAIENIWIDLFIDP